MIKGIKNEKLFRQKLYSGGVGRTYGGDVDNFYFGYYGDRLVIWEAKHKYAEHDYNGPQAHYLKKLVNHTKGLDVFLVWVDHESDDDIIHLKDCVPVKFYYKYKSDEEGKFGNPRKGLTVHDIANWADRRK